MFDRPERPTKTRIAGAEARLCKERCFNQIAFCRGGRRPILPTPGNAGRL